jgi:DedD protein
VERHVKERLVGAAVLMAAAIILIPEMLSGPDRDEVRTAEAPSRNTALKTYTIDLQQPKDAAAPHVVEERAPPVEAPPADTTEPAPPSQSNPESNVAEARTSSPTVAPKPEPESPSRTAVPSRDVQKEPATVSPQPTTSAPAASIPEKPKPAVARGWAVQIGSYSRQSAADRLAGELRGAGHSAFVMPIQTGGATLYRVRVGPMSDRAAATDALKDLKGRFPGAAVVAHP